GDEASAENLELGAKDEIGGDEAKTSEGQAARLISGGEAVEFRVKLAKEALTFRKIDIELVAINQDRQKVRIPLKRNGSSALEFSIPAVSLGREGRYQISAVLRAETKKGEEVEAESREVSFRFSPKQKFEEKAAPTPMHKEVVSEPQVERHSKVAIPWVLISLVVVPGCIAAGGLFSVTSRSKDRSSVAVQKYVPHKQLLDAIASMEERVSLNNVELTDPIFQEVEQRQVASEGIRDSSSPAVLTAESSLESKQVDPLAGLPNDI
ncbi:hypothetical protein EBZ37_11945, partial [bacterium]|nr:hypothetical protein [bacterium]